MPGPSLFIRVRWDPTGEWFAGASLLGSPLLWELQLWLKTSLIRIPRRSSPLSAVAPKSDYIAMVDWAGTSRVGEGIMESEAYLVPLTVSVGLVKPIRSAGGHWNPNRTASYSSVSNSYGVCTQRGHSLDKGQSILTKISQMCKAYLAASDPFWPGHRSLMMPVCAWWYNNSYK